MRVTIEGHTVELIRGDITQQQVDAIVNAANSRLAGGGGVDGAIHRVGGPTIMQETAKRYPEGCPTGSAVITAAGQLSAKYVIHAVGPVYREDDAQRAAGFLASAYRACLNLAEEHGCRSLAFPSLSTGAYRYPVRAASEVALQTTLDFLREHQLPDLVRFVLFSSEILQVFEETLETLSP